MLTNRMNLSTSCFSLGKDGIIVYKSHMIVSIINIRAPFLKSFYHLTEYRKWFADT